MKLRVDIDRIGDRYHTVVEPTSFSAAEEQLLSDHGEPIIQVGGNFTGAITRPGEVAPAVVFSGGGGTLAAATANVVDGEITSYTVSNPGTGYTSAPSVAITGGGGTGATATTRLKAVGVVVTVGGVDFVVDDTINLTGGTFTTPVTLKVDAVTMGVITAVTILTAGTYTVLPSNPVAQGTTSGVGVSATFTVTWGVASVLPGAEGSDYFTVPTPVDFTFPTKSRRIKTDFPDKRVFDLADTVDADLQAKLYTQTIQSRIETAIVALRARTNPFEGETLTTL